MILAVTAARQAESPEWEEGDCAADRLRTTACAAYVTYKPSTGTKLRV